MKKINQQLDIEKAKEICRKIAKSEEFKKFALMSDFTYTDRCSLWVWEDIFNCDFDECKIEFYHQPKRLFRRLIVGTYSNGLIRVNTAAVKTMEELVGSICHEYSHYLGYRHPYFNTPTRKMSVPYQLGYFFKSEAKKYV